MSNYMTPAITAAVSALQPYVTAGRLALGVPPGGQMLEVLTLDPTLAITAPPGLILLHPGAATTIWVYGDPAANLQPF
jgi:hypothetical protein